MRIWVFIIFLEILFVKRSIQQSTGLLKVSIYYESLCPDSTKFINQQLYPAYQKINSSLLIEFIPYGKACQTYDNGVWKFECQHGPKECWGNKAQACGLAENKGQHENVEFVNCIMSQPNPASHEALDICAPKLGLTGSPLIECAESSEGDQLHANYGFQTNTLRPTYIPTILFNGWYDYNLQNGALNNFLWTACSLLVNRHSACPTSPSENLVNNNCCCCG